MHEVLVNRLRGLSLPRKSVVRLTDRPDMTLDVYRGRKTTKQQSFSENISCDPALEPSQRDGSRYRVTRYVLLRNMENYRKP